MDIELRFVIAALAAWRVSFLVVREDGPLGVMRRLRTTLRSASRRPLLECVTCTGVWVSLPLAFFVTLDPIEWLVAWLGLAGVTALIDQWLRPPFEWKEASDDELLQSRPRDGDL